MPTPPYAKVLVRRNGGAQASGAITCAANDVIQLRLENLSGLASVRWELSGYPSGWATPAGWTLDAASRIIYCGSVNPPDLTLPSDKWGKWLIRALLNGGKKAQLVDATSALEIVSPNGLHALAPGEEAQFGGAAQAWVGPHEANLRIIDSLLGGSPGGAVMLALFGTGADGAHTVSTTETLTRDHHYTDLTIASGGKLIPNGFRVYVAGTLTVNSGGKISGDGGDAGPGYNDVGAAGPGGGSGKVLGGGTAGAGASSSGTGAGGPGVTITSPLGGAGGNGGQGYNDPWAGGTPNAVTLPIANPPDLFGLLQGYWLAISGGGSMVMNPCSGGSGGCSGGGGASGTGGAGGGGGGVIVLCARHVINNGSISANGGAGGDGAQTPSNCASGGGGGGGGGAVIVFCGDYAGSNPTATGGTGGARGPDPGTATGGNTDGAPGTDGLVLKLIAS